MADERVLMKPQPRNGPPFRIAFVNRGPEYWYNERLAWSRHGNPPMLFEWKCPFGKVGKPVFLNGAWYWEKE